METISRKKILQIPRYFYTYGLQILGWEKKEDFIDKLAEEIINKKYVNLHICPECNWIDRQNKGIIQGRRLSTI